MTRPKITPGEWFCAVPPSSTFATRAITDSNGSQIAELGPNPDTSTQTKIANATAIAALPDLLAALERVMPDWPVEDADTIPDEQLAFAIRYGELRQIRDALIKAGYTF